MATPVDSSKIKLNQADLLRAKATLIGIKDGFPRAFSRALNRAADGVKTDMVALSREKYNYKAAVVRKRITVKRATYSNLEAKTISVGPRVHLTDMLGTRQITTGLSVDVKKSTGRQKIKHGFKNKAQKSKKILAYRRVKTGGTRAGRYPIEALYAPHPEQVYNTRENWDRLKAQASERLDKNIKHETDAVLKDLA